MPPTVSINLCCYNSEKYLRETLESIVNQSFNDWELVVVNDGSADTTESIIFEYRDKGYPIVYKYQENQGLGAARNEAIRQSNGEYIAFVDHDDLWLPKKLEKQIELFNQNDKLGLVYCDTMFFNEKGDLFNIYAKDKPPRGMAFSQLLRKYVLSLETVLIRKKVLESTGVFEPKMTMAEEYDLFLRIAYKYPIDYVDEVLAKYRIHYNNYTWGKEMEGIREERETLTRLESFVPDFRLIYKEEIAFREKGLAIREGMAFWKENKRKEAKKMFDKVVSEYGGLISRLLSIFVIFMDYRLFRTILRIINYKKEYFLFG